MPKVFQVHHPTIGRSPFHGPILTQAPSYKVGLDVLRCSPHTIRLGDAKFHYFIDFSEIYFTTFSVDFRNKRG